MLLAQVDTLLPDPHFIYNSLNLLQAFIQEGDKQGALAHLSRFSKVLRQWLRHAAETAVPLSAEVALLETYLRLERDRFAASFDYWIVQELPCDSLLVKPLAWHRPVEQALYGQVLGMKGRGSVRITFTLDGGEPVCFVRIESSARDNDSFAAASEDRVSLIP